VKWQQEFDVRNPGATRGVYHRAHIRATREQPGMYAFLVLGNLVGIAICLWMAAGYTLADFLAPFGLSGLFRWGTRRLARARNPYSLSWLWIAPSATHATRLRGE
jgi:hypothetical protein